MHEEKKIEAFSIRCDTELKADAEGCAEAVGITLAMYARIAIREKVERDRAIYEGLHNVFGNAKKEREVQRNSVNYNQEEIEQ